MGGSIVWTGVGGFFEGITFRRPKIASSETPKYVMLQILDGGKIDMIQTVFDNEGSTGNVIEASGSGSKGYWEHVSVQSGFNGISLINGAHLNLTRVSLLRAQNLL